MEKNPLNNKEDKKKLTEVQTLKVKFMSGFLGSFASIVVCSPIDLIKVRIQTSHTLNVKGNLYSTIDKVLKMTFSKEGLSGFLNGLKMGVITSPIFYSIYFPVYEYSKRFYSNKIYKKEEFNSLIYTLSASTAAISSNLVTTPLWVLRVRHQTEYMISNKKPENKINFLNELSSIYKSAGIKGLYRGLMVELIGTPQVIIQFNIYESLTKKVKKMKNNNQLDYISIALISAFSKSKNYY